MGVSDRRRHGPKAAEAGLLVAERLAEAQRIRTAEAAKTAILFVIPSDSMAAVLVFVLISVGVLGQNSPPAKAGSADYQRGIAAMQQGDLATARTDFERAVRANPRSADAQNMLGQVLLREGEVEKAILHFRELVKLRPTLA